MKTLILSIVLVSLHWICLGQSKFDERLFRDYMKSYERDPVSFLQTRAVPDFLFIAGNGQVYDLQKTIGVYSYVNEGKREMSELKINQLGSTCFISGRLIHVLIDKKTLVANASNVRFIYVFAGKDNIWKLVTAQHTDYIPPFLEDEAAVKTVIEKETESFFKADRKTNSSCVLDAPYVSRLYRGGLFFGKDLMDKTDEFWRTHKASDVKFSRSDWNVRIRGNAAFATYKQAKESNGKTEVSFEERHLERKGEQWKIVNLTNVVKAD